jgi:glucosylglycerate synthase
MEERMVFDLSSEACSHLEKIKNADVLVGIPSYNNVLTASYVISQVVTGLDTYFHHLRSVIFVSDGNSVDGTLKSVRTVQLPCKGPDSCNPDLIPAVYVGISGKGSALRAIFEASHILGVKAVALVDSDLRSITPEWVKFLVSPVLAGTGMVVPFYNRRKYDGTITDFLCYPVTASLYGKNIRQPIGGDFGLSIELVDELLFSPLWNKPEVRSFGVDIFETHSALAKGFEVKQAFLGVKDHDPKDPTKHLGPMFRQVIDTMFTCIERYETVWKKIRGIYEVEMSGKEKNVNLQQPIQVDLSDMITTYKNAYDEYLSLYRSILSDDILFVFEQVKNLESEFDSFPMETWAKTVYSFIAAFHKAAADGRTTLIDALRILWIGRLASFIKETANVDPQKTEARIREQAVVFEKMKPYLIKLF